MATLDTIQTNLRTLIRETLGMAENSIREANQNMPTGARTEQFGTVLFTSGASTGQDNLYYTDNQDPGKTITETGIGQRKFLVSVQFFRGDAYEKALRLKTLLTMESVTVKLQSIGLGLARVGDARNLSAIVDTKWEARGQIDLDVHLIAREDIVINTYGEFPLVVSTETKSTSSEVFEP